MFNVRYANRLEEKHKSMLACVRVCVCACVRACVRVCVCACVLCVCMYVSMHACMLTVIHTHTHICTLGGWHKTYTWSLGVFVSNLLKQFTAASTFVSHLKLSPNVFNLSSFIWKTEHSSITQEVFHLLYEAVVRPHIQYYPVSGSLTRRKTRPHQTSPVTWHEPENKRITVLQQTERI